MIRSGTHICKYIWYSGILGTCCNSKHRETPLDFDMPLLSIRLRTTWKSAAKLLAVPFPWLGKLFKAVTTAMEIKDAFQGLAACYNVFANISADPCDLTLVIDDIKNCVKSVFDIAKSLFLPDLSSRHDVYPAELRSITLPDIATPLMNSDNAAIYNDSDSYYIDYFGPLSVYEGVFNISIEYNGLFALNRTVTTHHNMSNTTESESRLLLWVVTASPLDLYLASPQLPATYRRLSNTSTDFFNESINWYPVPNLNQSTPVADIIDLY